MFKDTKWLNSKGVSKFTTIDLFLAGIKPAIYINYGQVAQDILRKIPDVHTKVLQSEYGKHILISRNKLPNSILKCDRIQQIHEELGLLLGFYPEACKEFVNEVNPKSIDYNLGINFSGITFNAFGFAKEALEWCKGRYGEKLLNEFGYYYYFLELRGVTVERAIVRGDSSIIETL